MDLSSFGRPIATTTPRRRQPARLRALRDALHTQAAVSSSRRALGALANTTRRSGQAVWTTAVSTSSGLWTSFTGSVQSGASRLYRRGSSEVAE